MELAWNVKKHCFGNGVFGLVFKYHSPVAGDRGTRLQRRAENDQKSSNMKHLSPVDLVERPRVSETAIPDLIDHLCRLYIVFAVWP